MVKILITLLFIVSNAFAVEVTIEEDGHKKIVKIPDNGQSVILKMHRGSLDKKDTISLRIDGTKTNKSKICNDTPIKKHALKRAIVKQAPEKKLIKKQAKTIIITPDRTSTAYYPPKNTKTVETINVYHYFYPCSANPGMEECAPDNKIKIDNETDRMVLFYPDGTTKKIDMVDQRHGIRTTVINDGKEVVQDDLSREEKPIFDSRSYPNKQLPAADQYGRINKPTYNNQVIGVRPNNEK